MKTTVIKSDKEWSKSDKNLHPAQGSWMIDFINECCYLNRTIVSEDNYRCLEKVNNALPLVIHKYPTGNDYETWPVPSQWDIEEAFLSEGENGENIIVSYEDQPLFVMPYSKNFEGIVTREELLKHTTSWTRNPNHFCYSARIAANHKLRLNDWGITLPRNLADNLDKEHYHVKIRAKVSDGHLVVGEHLIQGREKKTFALLTHLCHPAQANDGLAGVAVGVEIMKRLRERNKQLRFSYQLLIMPETFGSAIYLADNQNRWKDYLASLFLEMPGSGDYLTFNHSRKGDLYFDKLLHYLVRRTDSNYHEYPFHRGMGNDELNFDWPTVNIPGLAIYWDNFPEYHTSADCPAILEENKLNTVIDVVSKMIDIIESDYVPIYKSKIQIYQTRYDLYVDAFRQPELYRKVTDLLFSIDGNKTLFEIVNKIDMSFEEANDYLDNYVELDFLEKKPVPLGKYEECLS